MAELRAILERNRGRLVVAAVLLVGLYFVVGFGEQAWRARQLQAEVAGRREAVAEMEARQLELGWQIVEYAADYPGYVERIARRDLNLARPGETVVLLRMRPAPEPEPAPTPDEADQGAKSPNWRAWLDLFGIP